MRGFAPTMPRLRTLINSANSISIHKYDIRRVAQQRKGGRRFLSALPLSPWIRSVGLDHWGEPRRHGLEVQVRSASSGAHEEHPNESGSRLRIEWVEARRNRRRGHRLAA